MAITDSSSPSPRRRVSDDTQRELLARYHRGALTQRAFCAEVGLPVSTLQWWLVKARREAARGRPVTFAEVSLSDVTRPDRSVGPAWAVEILTRTGVTLRLRDPLPPAELVAFLQDTSC